MWQRPQLPAFVELDAGNETCAREGHDWAPIGLAGPQGVISVPCRRAGCEAELRQWPHGAADIRTNGFTLLGMDLEDDPAGGVVKVVCREIQETYRLDSIPLKPGDVVLDIGAHVGAVSIYLAKKHPDVRIIAFEPVRANYQRLLRNIAANRVHNVTACNRAVTGDGRAVTLSGRPDWNSGGATICGPVNEGSTEETVPSLTLAEAVELFGFDRVALLKLDCEGAEYEIIASAGEWLTNVGWLVAEFHKSDRLVQDGHTPEKLVHAVARYIAPRQMHITITGV